MALIDRIYDANYKAPNRHYYRLWINGSALGFVDYQLVPSLPDVFIVNHVKKRIDINFLAEEAINCRNTIEQFFQAYFIENNIHAWRNERYALKNNFNDEPALLLERAILSYLGLTGFGVHVNGYTKKDNQLYMWIAKRAANKPTAPGKLDQIAAGGQPHNQTLFDNLIKECKEEANIPATLARHATPVSAVSYWYDMTIGARPDVIFNYDLYLPTDFIPTINDDEVESFELLALPEVLDIIGSSNQFKINSALVIIDFAIRHGVIEPTHPDYIALQRGMNLREEGIAFYTQ